MGQPQIKPVTTVKLVRTHDHLSLRRSTLVATCPSLLSARPLGQRYSSRRVTLRVRGRTSVAADSVSSERRSWCSQ